MTLKKYLSTLYLTKKIKNYKSKNISFESNKNEICENYYRVDDEDKDGRGLF